MLSFAGKRSTHLITRTYATPIRQSDRAQPGRFSLPEQRGRCRSPSKSSFEQRGLMRFSVLSGSGHSHTSSYFTLHGGDLFASKYQQGSSSISEIGWKLALHNALRRVCL